MKIKLCNIENAEKFMKVIDSCEGKVELITENGDKLNLKSKLSQYVSIIKLFGINAIKELEIVAYEKKDISILLKAMINGTFN